MKWILPILLLSVATPAMAQSSYDTGYNRGYTDQFPSAGLPNTDSSFSRGFQNGQDDSYEDDRMELLRRDEDYKRHEFEMQQIEHPEGTDDGN